MSDDELERAVERLQRKCGETSAEWGPLVVEASTVSRFREAVGLPTADALDVVPPTLLFNLSRTKVDVHRDARPQESLDEHLGNPVNGGSAYRWFRPVRVGETVSARVTLKSAELRAAKSGPLAIVVSETSVFDAARQCVAVLAQTIIYRGIVS